MGKTDIEWTDATWNPVRGCTKISPGCKHCYAAVFAERWRGIPGHAYEQGFDLRLVPDKLAEPLKWRTSRRIFVNSMSDLFHEQVPDEYVAAVFGVMAACPQHTFQVLTKRAARMHALLSGELPELCDSACRYLDSIGYERGCGSAFDAELPLPNAWLGVSVEDRKYGLPRIDELRATPAAVRFLSIEPLLEDLGQIDLAGIDWVIVGGESGHGARPMHPDWVRNIRDKVLALRRECAPCKGTGIAKVRGIMGQMMSETHPPCLACHGEDGRARRSSSSSGARTP
jgi:protein gp37